MRHGQEKVAFRLPVDVPVMKVAMKPAKLKRGKNTVTITAVESGTTPRSLDPNSPDERLLTVGFKRVRLDSQAR